MDNLLSAFYGKDHLDAVWAPNDALAIGIISSLKGVGYGSGQQAMPILTGQDADVQNVKNIVRGDQTSTVFKDTRRLAGVAADMVRRRCVTFVSHFDAHSRGGSGRRRSTFSRCSMGAATACRILSLAAR